VTNQHQPIRLGSLLEGAKSGFASGDNLDDGVFQLRMNNVTREGSLDLSKRRRVSATSKQLEMCSLQPGDVLFNATNSPELVGKSAHITVLDEPTTFSNHFIRLRADRSRLDSQFLARFLQQEFNRGVFGGLAKRWVNQAAVSLKSLEELSIPLPSLPEQRRIAAVLNQADELRTQRAKAISLLDDLAGSAFSHLFGDTATNSNGFVERRLADVGQLDRGVSKARPRNSPDLLGGNHPLIQTGDVANSGGYVRRHSQTYSDKGLAQSKLWPAGTLAITIAANIAKTGILTYPACFPDSVVGFTPKVDHAEVEYVRFWLRSLQQTLERQAPASAQKNINLAILRDLRIPLPGISLQRVFVSYLGEVERLREKQLAHLVLLNELFASLQHRAFRGEL
jgi:type I restriction enzyme S subunit